MDGGTDYIKIDTDWALGHPGRPGLALALDIDGDDIVDYTMQAISPATWKFDVTDHAVELGDRFRSTGYRGW